MNTASLNLLAATILAAQKSDRTPMGIAFAIASAGQHLTPEIAAELNRLRLLQNAQPAELSEAQVDALADAGNRALNDHYHDDLCHCSGWPEGCASSGNYFAGSWDTAAFSIGMAAVIGAWESMRARSDANELARLRAREPELKDDRRRGWTRYLTADERTNFLAELADAASGMDEVWAVDNVRTVLTVWRGVAWEAKVTGRAPAPPSTPVEDPHESPLHHAYTTGRDLPEMPRG